LNNLRVSCNSTGINTAVKIIKNGGIAVFPTDTVYGIGCDPYNKIAVESIYKIKNRVPSKLFPVLGYSKNELDKIAEFDERAEKIAEKFWPGRITLILKLKDDKIKQTMNLEGKIAVRIPNNQCVLSLLEHCRLLVGTSANISGNESFKDPNECIKYVTGYDVFVDGGLISSSGESTIVEIEKNDVKIHRFGGISKEEILNLI